MNKALYQALKFPNPTVAETYARLLLNRALHTKVNASGNRAANYRARRVVLRMKRR